MTTDTFKIETDHGTLIGHIWRSYKTREAMLSAWLQNKKALLDFIEGE